MRSHPLQGWHTFSDHVYNSSLMQEARNTERHGFAWGSSTRLRDNKIQFVSAGNLVMDKPENERGNGDKEGGEEESPPQDINKAIGADLDEAPRHSPSQRQV